MKVLITGSGGYIGSVMAPMVADAGHQVTGLDSGLFDDCDFGKFRQDFPVIRRDLRDVTANDIEGFEAVIHLGGLCNDPLSEMQPELTNDINYSASLRLAQLAKLAGVRRFLVSSSCSIYGASGDTPVTEDAPSNPVTIYGKCKIMLDDAISEMADDHFSPTFLRNATVYGASPRLRLDVVLNNLVAGAFLTGVILMKSDGTPWRPIVHVQDLSRAFIAVLQAPQNVIHNQVFNVGRNQENYRIRDLAEIVAETVPGCEIRYEAGAGPDKRCYRVDFSRLVNRLPEFRPTWDARRGAKELHEAFSAIGLREMSERYFRLAHIRKLIDSGDLDDNLRFVDAPLRAYGD